MIGRRDFITLLGGAAAAWPLVTQAQQSAMPTIGFLSSLRSNDRPLIVAAFQQGLLEAGYFPGGNIAIEYRWKAARCERLRAREADLVGRRVADMAGIGATR